MTGADPAAVNIFGARRVFREPLHSHGDVFPLPWPVDEGFPHNLSSLCSRRSRQRVQRRRVLHIRERGTVWALNHLAGFDDESLWPSTPMNRAQATVLGRVKRAHLQRPPPPEKTSPQAALRQLLQRKAGSAYSEGLPGQLASYVRERLSLPRGQGKPVLLEELLPEAEREMMANFQERMMLSDEEIAGVLEKGLGNDMYTDPLLEGGGKTYHGFVADLVKSQLVGFTAKPRAQVGVFVVTKKAQKQRLILDARRTNKLFRSPPTTRLGSMDSWTRLGISEGEQMFVAQEDVKDFFYRLGIKKDLGEYFCLPCVNPVLLKDELGTLPEEIARLLDEGFQEIYPHMSVLPMGFSWAFHLAHEAHAELGKRTLPQIAQVRDREPAPLLGRKGIGDMSEACLIYADNHNHLGIDREQVHRAQQDMIKALHSHGLDTHDLVESTPLCESLGVRIDGLEGSVQVTAARDHRLDQALLACSARPALSGEELQVIVGHMTMRSLLNRGLLSILRHIYVFIQENYLVRRSLWPSVVREIEIFRCLMVLGGADLRAGWDPRVYCTDACPSGYAVMERDLGSQEARGIGKEDERWRFYRCESQPPPRAAALGDILEDVRTVRPDVDGEGEREWVVDAQFPEVPRWVLDAGEWKLLWRAGFEHKDGIHVLEARSILGAVKHVCRDSQRHGVHMLVLNDNMGTVLASQKGRCAHFGLLRVLRRVAAHTLGCGIRCHVRWVPSELNVADYDSRWRERHEGSRPRNACGPTSRHEEEEKGECVQPGRGQTRQREVQMPIAGRKPGEKAEGEKPDAREAHFDSADAAVGTSSPAKGAQEEDGASSQATEKIWSRDPRLLWRKVLAGGSQCVRGHEEGLLCEGGGLPGVHKVLHAPDKKGKRSRRGLVRVRRQPLPEWRNVQLWPKAPGGARVCAARECQGGLPSVAPIQKGAQRLAQAIPSSGQTANDRIPKGGNLWSSTVPGQARYGAVQRADVLHLREAGRGVADESSGFCREAARASRVPVLRHCSGTNRAWRSQQGGDLRRGAGHRRCAGPVAGRHHEAACDATAPDGRGDRHVELQCPPVPRHVEESSGCSGHRRLCTEPLPEQTWRSQSGPSVEASQRGGYPEERSLGGGLERPDLRQAGQTAADGEQAQQEVVGPGRKGPVELPGFVPQWYLPSAPRASSCAERLREGKFLSLFGGVGECAKAYAERGGSAAVVDLSQAKANDLSKFSAWNRVRQVAYRFNLIGIDLPCNTWTRARRAPPWSRLPGPLRGDHSDSILGLPQLKPGDQLKVQAANRMMYGACKLIRLCLRLGVSGYLENPLTSRLWLAPPMKDLLNRDGVHFIKTDMCMHGTQWKKPVGLLVWGCEPFSLPRCTCRSKCSRTGKNHVQLTGIKGSRFATERAQMFPSAFASKLVDALC